MIGNGEAAALQMAIIQIMMKHAAPEIRQEIMDVAKIYRSRFFYPQAEIVPSIEKAFNYLVDEVEKTCS